MNISGQLDSEGAKQFAARIGIAYVIAAIGAARGLDAHPHPAYPRLHAPTHPLAHVMNALIRFLFGARLPIAVCLISALLAGAAVWKFQAMRYEARLARAQAALVSYRAKIASANARLEKAQARVVTR